MTRDEAIVRLQQHEADLGRFGVERRYLFASTARATADTNSDVDLFFDFENGKLGLFGLMELKERAAAILGCPTDIMTRDSIPHVLRARIEQSAVRVF